MKNLLFIVCILGILFTSCSKKDLKVTVENQSDFDRQSDLVEIPVEGLKAKLPLEGSEVYIVTNAQGDTLTTQVTSDGKLLFQSGLKAKETGTYTITKGAYKVFNAKTYGRFVTERKDDFAWENDRVAFRIYGPALIAIDGPSNGIDIWYKRTNDLIIDKWYKDDLTGVKAYHEDHGEGLDDYKVGRSLGAGAMAPFVGGKLWLNENFASQQVIDNGPLRTTFKLTYKDIGVNGKTYAETRTISIDAGSQLSKITQEYGDTDSTMTVAAGIVKRENDSIITSLENNYVIYAEPTSEKVGNVYLALVFPEGFKESVVDTYTVTNPVTKKEETFSHVLGVTEYKPNTPVTYYTGYGWSKFGFANEAEFQKYVENFAKGLKQPLVVKY
ncbi:MAG: DUF4861 domain-containing protein [Dysgonomonas sp.]